MPLKQSIALALLLLSLSHQTTQAADSKSNLDLIPLKLCVIKERLPFQHVQNGLALGIVADISHIIGAEMSTVFNIIETNNELHSLNTLRSGQCDVSFILIHDQQEDEDLVYSTTISHYPIAIAVLASTNIDLNLNSYRERRLAVDPSHFINIDSFLGDLTPSIMPLDTAISAVSMGAVDGVVDVMPLIIAKLNQSPQPNIKVVELALDPLSLKVVMNSKDQDLMDKVNAIIRSVPEQKMTAIEHNWLSINYQLRDNSWSKWFLIIIPIFLLLALRSKKDKSILKETLEKINLENKDLNHKLSTLEQQESLGLRFVEIISHEYRTPVSVISANADILDLKNNQGNLGLSGQITKIRDAVTRLISIVETTLDREQLSSENMIANMTKFDFMLCMNQVVAELSRTYINRTVSIEPKPESLMYLGDKKLMSLMLRNVIENTFKYSPSTKPVEINLELTETHLQIMVRDHGIGIPHTEIEHIFEKYHRAANTANTPGIGIGLYLTKSIVIQHHGQISVHCPDEGGTEVLIILPVDHSSNIKVS